MKKAVSFVLTFAIALFSAGASAEEPLLAVVGSDGFMLIKPDPFPATTYTVVRRWQSGDASDPASASIPEGNRNLLKAYFDEAKYFKDEGKIAVCSAGSAGALMSVDNIDTSNVVGRCLWSAPGVNAHSICTLPNNRVAMAYSTGAGGNRVAIYDQSSGTQITNVTASSCHGVVWDDKRQRVYCVSDVQVFRYSLQDWSTSKPWLKPEGSFYLNHNLHDLTRKDEDTLVASGGNSWSDYGAWEINLDNFVETPIPAFKGRHDVKGIQYCKRTGTYWATLGYYDTSSWYTYTLHEFNPASTNPVRQLSVRQINVYRVRDWSDFEFLTSFACDEPTATAGVGSGTVSLKVNEILTPVSVTMTINGATVLSQTGVTVPQTFTAAKAGLRKGTYPAMVEIASATKTNRWDLSFSVTVSGDIELGGTSARVADNGASAILLLDLVSIPEPPAAVVLSLNGTQVAATNVTDEGTVFLSAPTVPGSTNGYSFAVTSGSKSATASGTFVATVYTNWFTVDFAGATYSSGSNWMSSVTDQGTWTAGGIDGSCLDPASRRVLTGMYSELTFTPSEPSESGADVEISGECTAVATYAISNPDAASPLTALGFEGSGIAGGSVTPILWTGSEWARAPGTWNIADGDWVAWKVRLDLTSEDAPRARVTMAGTESGWVTLECAGARSATAVRYVGEGAIGSFAGGFHSRMIGPAIIVEIPKPVFGAVGDKPAFFFDSSAHTFSVTVANAVEGVCYRALTATDIKGPWTPEGVSVQREPDGTVTLTVDASAPAKFLKVEAGGKPFGPGGR